MGKCGGGSLVFEYEAEVNKGKRALELLKELVERAEMPDQCLVCHELLDTPENDNGDGEWLGHALSCPIASAKELLEE